MEATRTENKMKWSIRAIAAARKQTIADLAKDANLNANHLLQVSAGNTVMTATDLANLCKLTNIPYEEMQIEYSKNA